jgi:hypothetical protein
MNAQTCPVCEGQKIVTTPPGWPAGRPFSSSAINTYTCGVCNGHGYLVEDHMGIPRSIEEILNVKKEVPKETV